MRRRSERCQQRGGDLLGALELVAAHVTMFAGRDPPGDDVAPQLTDRDGFVQRVAAAVPGALRELDDALPGELCGFVVEALLLRGEQELVELADAVRLAARTRSELRGHYASLSVGRLTMV